MRRFAIYCRHGNILHLLALVNLLKPAGLALGQFASYFLEEEQERKETRKIEKEKKKKKKKGTRLTKFLYSPSSLVHNEQSHSPIKIGCD